MVDLINRPPHYNKSTIQPLHLNDDWCLPFELANAVKYINRYRYKGTSEQDLDKAIFYINYYCKKLDSQGLIFRLHNRLNIWRSFTYSPTHILFDWKLPISFDQFFHTLYKISQGKLSTQQQKMMLTQSVNKIRHYKEEILNAESFKS